MKAFTLVELLITLSVIGLLAALGLPALNNALQAGRKAKEVGAIKGLITAYNTYSSDNNNMLLKSYDQNGTATDINGKEMSGEDSHEAHRWPWRLAPYFNYGFYTTTHVNDMELAIKAAGGLSQAYLVSVIPSFGLNINCGGNDYEGGSLKTSVSNYNQVNKPSQFITFVSSRSSAMGKKYEGFYYTEVPKLTKWSKSSSPKSTGYVSARYNGQVIVAFLGGNVSVLNYEELVKTNYWVP